MRSLVTLCTVITLALLSAPAHAQKAKPKSDPPVCTVGMLSEDAKLSVDRYAESVLDEGASRGDELPIISFNSEICRTVNSEGKDVFLPRSKVVLGKKLDRYGVLSKVVELERAGMTEDDSNYVIWVRFYDRVAEQQKGGDLPQSSGEVTADVDSPPTIRIKNDTKYRITVTYSGPSTRSVTLSPGDSKDVTLKGGQYRVSASADTRSVRPFYGSETLNSNCRYSVSYYIVTRRG